MTSPRVKSPIRAADPSSHTSDQGRRSTNRSATKCAASSPTIQPQPAAETLTRREREVALLLAQGRSDREIAAALAISPGTAGIHVHRILAKLVLRSRHQVAAWAVAQGLLPRAG